MPERKIKMSRFLWPVFGEAATVPALFMVCSAGAIGFVFSFWYGSVVYSFDSLRLVILSFIGADLASGSIANLSSGTNLYYRFRPFSRLVFLFLNASLPAGLLFLFPEGGIFWIALYAFASGVSFIVLWIRSVELQRMVAGLALAVGCAEILSMAGIYGYAQFLAFLFLFKIVYAFSVRHEFAM